MSLKALIAILAFPILAMADASFMEKSRNIIELVSFDLKADQKASLYWIKAIDLDIVYGESGLLVTPKATLVNTQSTSRTGTDSRKVEESICEVHYLAIPSLDRTQIIKVERTSDTCQF